eukprot:12917720-Prorocentrum_lima.AAC.1
MVEVYQGTGVEPVRGTLQEEVGTSCKDQVQRYTFTRTRCEGTQICAIWGVHCERLWSRQGNTGK